MPQFPQVSDSPAFIFQVTVRNLTFAILLAVGSALGDPGEKQKEGPLFIDPIGIIQEELHALVEKVLRDPECTLPMLKQEVSGMLERDGFSPAMIEVKIVYEPCGRQEIETSVLIPDLHLFTVDEEINQETGDALKRNFAANLHDEINAALRAMIKINPEISFEAIAQKVDQMMIGESELFRSYDWQYMKPIIMLNEQKELIVGIAYRENITGTDRVMVLPTDLKIKAPAETPVNLKRVASL